VPEPAFSIVLINNGLCFGGRLSHGFGKFAMARYAAQPTESTRFRLTRPFRVAYTRLATLAVAAPASRAAERQENGRKRRGDRSL